MPEVAFVISAGQDYLLRELALTVRHELELQGVPSSLHIGGFPGPRADRVYVLLDPGEYVRIEGEQALPDESILRRTIFLVGQAGSSLANDEHLDLLRRAGVVFAIDHRTVVAMHRVGIPARLLRPGYSRSLDRFDAQAERPIDVMFMGRHSLRRAKHLARAAGVLSRRNCLLQISEDAPNPGGSTSYLAEGRWPLLAKTKVVISLHHHDDDHRFDWCAALDAIHAGAVVVSEHSSGIAPLEVGHHLLVASPDSLPFVAETLLRDEGRLARMREQAYERLSEWVPFALPVSVLRAAAVELVGAPIRPGVSMGRPPHPVDEPQAVDHPSPELRSVRRELSGVKLDLLDLRRKLGRLQETLRSAHGATAVDVVHQSPAWRARRACRLTVVTALRGDREALRFTLDSLLHSRQRDFELVVVDAGSSDRTLRSAQDWMRAHPRVATSLVASAASQSVGAARNIGLDFARSPFCLILDPAQAVTPTCIDVLLGTLGAMPEITFVYPMQEVTGADDAFVTAGGNHLVSFLGWDPARLRHGNYIHPPALIRTDALRSIGGFAVDERLDGLEDFDLWCRMAERGWRGQLVPQELARRAESGSSVSLVSMTPTPGPAGDLIMERAPGLMAGAFAPA